MTFITGHSGKNFNYVDPTFAIEDMAHALSHIARFNGHTDRHWSVAQHLLCCAAVASDPFKLEALMHDAHEAYLCDVPTPMKSILPDYLALEARCEGKMRQQFGLPSTMSDEVRRVDGIMLNAEAYVFHRQLWTQLGSREPGHFAVEAIRDFQSVSTFDVSVLYLDAWRKLFPRKKGEV